jgi:hypothetical protein
LLLIKDGPGHCQQQKLCCAFVVFLEGGKYFLGTEIVAPVHVVGYMSDTCGICFSKQGGALTIPSVCIPVSTPNLWRKRLIAHRLRTKFQAWWDGVCFALSLGRHFGMMANRPNRRNT